MKFELDDEGKKYLESLELAFAALRADVTYLMELLRELYEVFDEEKEVVEEEK